MTDMVTYGGTHVPASILPGIDSLTEWLTGKNVSVTHRRDWCALAVRMVRQSARKVPIQQPPTRPRLLPHQPLPPPFRPHTETCS